MSATSVGQIGLDLVVNKKQFNKQMKSLDSVAVKMGQKIGGALMAGFSVKKIAEFGQQCIELGSDLQEVENVVGVTFPSMSSKIDKFAKDAAGSFGLSETMAKKYSSTLGSMAKAFGFTESEAYDMGTTLAGLAGDVASFYNLSQDEAYTKLKSIFTGETESLKDLGVVMTQSALDSYALANGFGKTTSAMSEAEKVALRYSFVQDKLSAAQGDFARTSDSWANQTKVLSLQFESLKSTIGQGLITAFTPVIKMINTLLQKLQVLAVGFKDLMENIFGAQSTESNALATTAEAAALAAESTADSTGATADNLKKANKFLAGFDVINKMSDNSSGSNGSGNTSISSAVTDASDESSIGMEKTSGVLQKKFGPAFEKTFKKIEQKLDKFKKTFSKFGRDIQKDIQPFADYIAGPFTEKVGGAFNGLWEDFIKPVFEFIEDVFYDFISILNSFWNNWANPILQNFQKAMDKTADAVAVAWRECIKPVMDTLMECLDKLWNEHMAPLAENFMDFVGEFVNGALEIYNKFIVPLVDYFAKLLTPIIEKFVKDTAELISNVIDIFNGIITTCKGIIQFISGVFTGDWSKAWEGVKNIFKGIFDSLVAIVRKPVNMIIDIINGMIRGIVTGINTIIKGINSISLTVPDWIPGIGGSKIGFNLKSITAPEIPKLAGGGFVKKNTPQLAIIGDNRHQGEVVSPEDKLLEMATTAARLASGNDYSLEILKVLKEILEVLREIDFDIVIDGKKLKDIIVEKINQHTAQTGVCEIIV